MCMRLGASGRCTREVWIILHLFYITCEAHKVVPKVYETTNAGDCMHNEYLALELNFFLSSSSSNAFAPYGSLSSSWLCFFCDFFWSDSSFVCFRFLLKGTYCWASVVIVTQQCGWWACVMLQRCSSIFLAHSSFVEGSGFGDYRLVHETKTSKSVPSSSFTGQSNRPVVPTQSASSFVMGSNWSALLFCITVLQVRVLANMTAVCQPSLFLGMLARCKSTGAKTTRNSSRWRGTFSQ